MSSLSPRAVIVIDRTHSFRAILALITDVRTVCAVVCLCMRFICPDQSRLKVLQQLGIALARCGCSRCFQVVANFHTIRDRDICSDLLSERLWVFTFSVWGIRVVCLQPPQHLEISVSSALFFSPCLDVNRHCFKRGLCKSPILKMMFDTT